MRESTAREAAAAQCGCVNCAIAAPERERRLIRLWLDAPGFRDVPKESNLFKTNGVPRQQGRRASFDFRKLYAEDPRKLAAL